MIVMKEETSMEDQRIIRTLTVSNRLGLHARPASLLAKTAGQFSAEIIIAKDEVEANAKSIMALLMLAAGCGSDLVFSAQGEDALEALDALEQLIASKFGED
jgi:phosphocarrier protein